MKPARFATEDQFQALLAQHPELLVGDQIDPDEPRRWLLVSREPSIPGEEAGAGRWNLDHLFVDQDAIPTLVEVKRASDTRLRREVVGQLLDYAANGSRFWRIESLQADHARLCGDVEPADDIRERLGIEETPSDFWARVGDNLRRGRLRLLFVADVIPPELRTVIEFLNRSMPEVEVLGVELRQYEGGDLRTIVPLVMGHVAKPLASHAASAGGRLWDRVTLMAAAAEKSDVAAAFMQVIFDFADKRSGASLKFGKGRHGSCYISTSVQSRPLSLLFVDLVSGVGLPLGALRALPHLSSPEAMEGLLSQLDTLLLTPMSPEKRLKDWPWLKFDSFRDADSLRGFLAAIADAATDPPSQLVRER